MGAMMRIDAGTFRTSLAGLHRAGSIVLQLVRPDIRQSCRRLADVRSCASHRPKPSIAAAISKPTMAPRRL
jgi:hypothetical protein